MRKPIVALLAGASCLTASLAVAGETASVTRIETRPFYGATVTIEEGVRVFRALPPHQRIIINPEGKASVSLSFEENRSKNYNYDKGTSGEAAAKGSSGADHGGVYGGHVPRGGRAPHAQQPGGVKFAPHRRQHGQSHQHPAPKH